ncbi:hypothetical protein [Mesorhizobium delmotii]|uniref:Uncharacterized protein n=1 Tax=Mesorhizobium delmotii TaxID=1631247 RepID=A0A2P9APG4_9HYPH|nr:hypothetical protein [Mesorhizobium delmotii]SJM33016.1 hypothetical protein BQ8482_330151 [Mesorhizobium delmotii]
MTEPERQEFKARKAAYIEALFRKLFSERKAEAHLAVIARRAERERELWNRTHSAAEVTTDG